MVRSTDITPGAAATRPEPSAPVVPPTTAQQTKKTALTTLLWRSETAAVQAKSMTCNLCVWPQMLHGLCLPLHSAFLGVCACDCPPGYCLRLLLLQKLACCVAWLKARGCAVYLWLQQRQWQQQIEPLPAVTPAPECGSLPPHVLPEQMWTRTTLSNACRQSMQAKHAGKYTQVQGIDGPSFDGSYTLQLGAAR